jgi:uncharacterized protein with LGFP repeats
MAKFRGVAAVIGAAALTLVGHFPANASPQATAVLAASAQLPVTGSFGELWRSTGAEAGFLGQPTSGEVPIRNGGVFQNFQGGTLYWTAPTGAHSVSGDFLRFYGAQGYENGFLGYPTSQENPIRNGGVYQNYQGGTLYWTAATGTHSVSGAFGQLYGSRGWENGDFGYPTSQEVPIRGGVFQNYQGGTFYWSATTGAQALQGSILDAYRRTGSEGGFLGYPTSSEFDIAGGKRTNFQGGYIEWSASRGALVNQSIATPVAPTVSQQNAVRKAEEYLRVIPFSRSGLIGQLEYEGFSTADATYGVDHVQVDWYEQASKKAADYLEVSAFSREGLIDQLEFEGFTYDQAVYGVNSVGL